LLAVEGPILLPALVISVWLVRRGIAVIPPGAERTLLGSVLLLPWLALILLAPWIQLAEIRYLAFQAPFLLLLLASGTASLGRPARYFAAAAFGVITVVSLLAYYGVSETLVGYPARYAKEDWRGAAEFVRRSRADTVLISPSYLSLPLTRYPLGPARQIEMPAEAYGVPDLREARRIALVIGRAGLAQGKLRAAMDATYSWAAEEVFLSQHRITVVVYDIPAHSESLAAANANGGQSEDESRRGSQMAVP
jgi:hypothetical protein